MATLLQQWARRYLQIVRQSHPPHVRAHIREYFYQGARRFGLFGLAELLPFLLIVSVLLFFSGLVAFAFLANHTVANITLTIVGFCFLSYIALTLMPLVFRDCPYWTPLTTVLWFSGQKIGLAFYWVRDRGATYLHRHWDLLSERRVELYCQMHVYKAKLWSEDMVSQLEESAKRISMGIYTKALTWTLHQLGKDYELEEFVAGIPDLYEYIDFVTTADIRHVERDIQPRHIQHKARVRYVSQCNIRRVLAVLPGPSNFDAPLSRSILLLAQRAFFDNLSKHNQQKRVQTCLRALHHIPGAIRDLLAPYAAVEDHFLYSLGLLNSQESLEVINELWYTQYLDVALSVRCAAAVVAAVMITPPVSSLKHLITLNLVFIGDDNTGKQFLAQRLRVSPTADGGVAPELLPKSDTARLQNIVRFLVDIKDPLQYTYGEWWSSDDPNSIRRERHALSELRYTEAYRDGYGLFDQKGDRASPAFIPAAQQDLITLTLEILARGSVADAVMSQREAFRDVYMQFEQEVMTLARGQLQAISSDSADLDDEDWVDPTPASAPDVLLESREVLELEDLALAPVQAADFIKMIRRALEPVLLQLGFSVRQNATPHADHTSPPQMPMQQIVTAPSTVSPILPDSTSSSAGPATAVGGLSDSYV
jgi:hypothetical protein